MSTLTGADTLRIFRLVIKEIGALKVEQVVRVMKAVVSKARGLDLEWVVMR